MMINRKFDHLLVHLELQTYIGGYALGAQHYYGVLRQEGGSYIDGRIDVEKVMTSAEAKRLNKLDTDDGWRSHWKKGDTTSRIETVDGVKEAAVAMWKEHFPKAKVLYTSWSYSAYEPREILDVNVLGTVDYRELNRLASEYVAFDETHDDSDKSWRVRKRLNAEWEQKFVEFLEVLDGKEK